MNEEIEYNVGDKVYYSKVEYGIHTIEEIRGIEVLLSCPSFNYYHTNKIGNRLSKFWTITDRIFLVNEKL